MNPSAKRLVCLEIAGSFQKRAHISNSLLSIKHDAKNKWFFFLQQQRGVFEPQLNHH